MTQIEKFLRDHGVDLSNMSYNELNYRISIANKVAEESFKECILKLCGYGVE